MVRLDTDTARFRAVRAKLFDMCDDFDQKKTYIILAPLFLRSPPAPGHCAFPHFFIKNTALPRGIQLATPCMGSTKHAWGVPRMQAWKQLAA